MSDDGVASPRDPEGEVSLIDIIAVLLRYRRFILLSLLAAALIAAAVFVLYPPLKLARIERDRIVEVNAGFMLESGVIAGLAESERTNFMAKSLLDAPNLLEALQAAGYDTVDAFPVSAGSDRDKALYTIRRRLIENKDSGGDAAKETDRVYSVKVDGPVITVVFKNGDPEKAIAFMRTLGAVAERELKAYMRPFALATMASYERLLAIQDPSEVIESSIVQGYRDYSAAKAIVQGGASPVFSLREPYVLIPEVTLASIRGDVFSKCALLMLAAFFLAIFAAFVLHYVATVKGDPDAMKKIKGALGKE